MSTATLVIGIILLVFSVFLIVAVLMQQGKTHNLSGTIAGGAETFFGKSKAQTMNKKLSILTSVVAIIFVLLVVGVYCISTDNVISSEDETEVTTVADDAAETTVAESADGTVTADTTTTVEDTTAAEEAETEDTQAEESAAEEETAVEA